MISIVIDERHRVIAATPTLIAKRPRAKAARRRVVNLIARVLPTHPIIMSGIQFILTAM